MNRKKIITVAASALLALTYTCPAVTPVFADDQPEGSGKVKIVKNNNNKQLTYIAYRIFKARVEDTETEGKKASDISWAADSNFVSAVVNLIKSQPDAGTKDYTNARTAAEYITAHITGTKASTVKDDGSWNSDGTRAESGTFASKLASAVADAGIKGKELSGEQTTLQDGYYLIVTKTSDKDWSKNAGQNASTATSPIFAMIGGSDVNVSEKTSVPTVSKTVTDDVKGAQAGKTADADADQDLLYTLTGTAADNIRSYGSYYYKFTDTLNHLAYTDKSATAFIENADGSGKAEIDPAYYTVNYSNRVLTVEFTNLNNIASKGTPSQFLDAGHGHKIVVEYRAHIDSTDKYIVGGGTGDLNKNTVNITYSNNPLTSGNSTTNPEIGTPVPNDHKPSPKPTSPDVGTTTDEVVYTYTYGLKLTKLSDDAQQLKLPDARFTIQSVNNNDGMDSLYVQENGSLGKDAHVFATAKDGKDKGTFDVSGLDAGTYKVHETKAPVGYDSVNDFYFKIVPTYSTASVDYGKLAGLKVYTGDDLKTLSESTNVAYVSDPEADQGNGVISMNVKDRPGVSLPLTGQQGIALGVAVGGIIIAVSATAIVKSRKKAEEEAETAAKGR